MTAGYWMLLAVGAGMLVTGLPAAFVLLAVATLAAGAGVLLGLVEPALLGALPGRIVGLLESDLLQALPLYVLMGALLHRLPLASTLFRAFTAALPASPAAPRAAALGLGALLGPMNGSVGASVAMLARAVYPPLRAAGTPAAPAVALVCMASTLGVVVPPSLVLILLGDALMRAHSEALTVTHAATQVVNTQDVFRGALVPALLLLAAALAVAWFTARRDRPGTASNPAVPPRDWLVAATTLALVGGLLGAVALGVLYAVEAAATGAVLLIVAALVSRELSLQRLQDALRDTLAISGALFALLLAATTFTLVFRAFGTDRHLTGLIVGMHGGTGLVLGAVLGLVAACALVLDAFEIIFVVVPLVLPPLLVRVPDATWVAVLVLLTLQASFLVPPFGYAVMMSTGSIAEKPPLAVLARALLPYLLAQWLVMAAVLAFPVLTHLAQGDRDRAPPAAVLTDDQQRRMFENALPPPDENAPPPPDFK